MKFFKAAGIRLMCQFFLVVMLAVRVSAQSPAAYYDSSKQRLLARSAALFITNVTQGAVEPDSAILFACRIYHFGRLLPYNGDYPPGSDPIGSRLIESGRIGQARQLNRSLSLIGVNSIRSSVDLATYYLFKPGTEKKDLDSSWYYLQKAMQQSRMIGREPWMNVCLMLMAKWYYQSGDPVKGQLYFSKVIAACDEQDEVKCLALACETAGAYLEFKDPDRIKYLQRALKLFEQLGMKEQQIEVQSAILAGYFWTNWPKVPEVLQKVLDLQTEIGYRHTYFVHYTWAYLLAMNGTHIGALDHDFKALESMKAVGDTTFYPCLYMRIGSTYNQLGKEEEAISWYKKSIIGRTRETQPLWYTGYLTLLSNKIDHDKLTEAMALINEVDSRFPPGTRMEKMYAAIQKGWCYQQLGDYQKALVNYELFISIAGTFPPEYIGGMIPQGYYRVANFYFLRGRYDKARYYLDLSKLTSNGQSNNKYNRASRIFVQYELDSATGKYLDAIRDHIEYMNVWDSLKNVAQQREINELMVKNETQKKDQDIHSLKQKDKLQRAQISQSNFVKNVLVAGAFLLLVIAGMLFYQYRMKRSANKIITGKNESMQQLLQEKERLLADKEILMKEIHHRVKNNLHLISSLLESQSAYLDNEALFAVQKSQHRVQAISLIHQKLYMGENVTSVLMSVYLREIVTYLRDSFAHDEGLIFKLDVDSILLDVSQAVPLGLIVNEAITNSIKYAFPGRKGTIEIVFKSVGDNECHLTIADNGIGLPEDLDMNKNNSLGMNLIRGLSNTLMARLYIGSHQGTRIELVFVNANAAVPIA